METPRPDTLALVVNGDDFGHSPAVNAAILRCHRDGILTSATLLANLPAAAEALALATAHPALGVGLHLNLTEGTPILPPGAVPSLVGRGGAFVPFPAQFARVMRGTARLPDIEREFRAQIEAMLAAGVRPTHLDGHLHVHAYPQVLQLTLRLMAEYDIRALRSPVLVAWLPLYPEARYAARVAGGDAGAARLWRQYVAGWGGRARTRWAGIAGGLSRRGPQAASLARAGVVAADYLLDSGTLLRGPDPAAALVATLAPARGGIAELMTHPGYAGDPARGAAEVALLTAPRLRAMLRDAGVRLVHYGQLTAATS